MSTIGQVAPLDGEAFAREAQRITNTASHDEWLALYHPDAVFEVIADGAYERYDGIDEIRRAVAAQIALWREKRLRVAKHVECVSDDTIVLTWRGGFEGRESQFGTEIWTLHDGLVVHHQMYLYLDVRPSTSLRARLRVLLSSPRLALAILQHQRRTA